MKIKTIVKWMTLAIAMELSGTAQDITIYTIGQNGSMSFTGIQSATTATVEWAASLTDTGRTNWHNLTNIYVTTEITTNDIPMFFRVRGIADTNLLRGLIAFFPFDGNANDESGNTNNGTVSNQILTTDRFGHSNSAYAFTNSNPYSCIDCGADASLNPNNYWTISVRFNSTSWAHTSYPSLLSRRDDHSLPFWELYYDTVSKGILFSFSGTGGTNTLGANTAVTLNDWHMATVTGSDTLKTMYVDGQVVAQQTNNYVPNLSASLRIGILGGDSGAQGQQFVGRLDDIRIYNRALSANEVLRLYNLSE